MSQLSVPGESKLEVEMEPVMSALKKLYKSKILPVEKDFNFAEFHSPSLTDTDFDAKPMVLLVGQYSVGKTTFIRYLLERDFPGVNIGPEPTTDKFMAIQWGREERIVPGNALAADANKPFTALTKFGMAFLNRFEGSTCPSPILEKVTFIDTPGVLSGEKQMSGRSYNFPEIVAWFAERCDRILLLFDAHKLDISDEFKLAIDALKGNDDKVRVVLNKADMETQKLMRVYGALMWSLGKITQTPEVLRVYVGSFWDQKLRFPENEQLIEAEMRDLLADLRSLPRNSAIRKINETIKRARMTKVHVLVINHLRNQFGMFGKESLQKKLLENLLDEFKKVQKEFGLPPGDFPNVAKFRDTLAMFPIHKFPKLNKKQISLLDELTSKDIPHLMELLPTSGERTAHDTDAYAANPFQESAEKHLGDGAWVIDGTAKKNYDVEFYKWNLTADGKMTGQVAKQMLIKTGVNTQLLRKIWDLSDIDKDGALDTDEFAVAMHLVGKLKSGELTEPPDQLQLNEVPPSKRDYDSRFA
jgi:GTPase SAR1 family protein